MKRLFTTIFLNFTFHLLLSTVVFAQTAKMSIEGKPQKSSNEIVGKRDSNGKFCAAVQVVSDMDGFKYQSYNGVVAVDDQPGRDMVYLSPNERVLEIFKSGYEPLKLILSEYGIQLKERDVWQIKIKGQAKTGDLLPVTIITQPAGAQIDIEGKVYMAGEAIQLKKGEHKVSVSKTGYQSKEETITVSETNVFFKYELSKVQDLPIEIKTEPSGADVWLDKLKIGQSPLTTFYPSGQYPIRIEKEWYLTYEGALEINPPVTRKTFKLKPNFGSLRVSSAPQSGLTIYMDGKATQYKTPHTFERLKPVAYTISAKNKLYETPAQTITVNREGRQSLALNSEENFAVLNIKTLEGAVVYLNGKALNERSNIRLEPQVAVIKVEKPPKGKAVEKRIVLKKQERQTLEIYPVIETGSLQLAVSPFEAEIELLGDAGEKYSAQTAKIFKDMPIGIYQLTVKKQGYKSHKASIRIRKGQTAKYNAVLVEGSDVPEGFVFVKGGTFQMGSTNGEGDEKPVHSVTVDDFYMSKYEVTNADYIKFLNDKGVNSNGSYGGTEYIDMDDGDCAIGYRNGSFYFKGSNDADDEKCPVIEVTWYGADAYCKWAGGRLPTEAEWEYAARGGNKSNGYRYAGSHNADEVAWYNGSPGRTHPVGQKKPNELGLYDMSGNVWEWCSDWYSRGYYENSPSSNPKGPSNGSDRVDRGGSWNNYAKRCRVANRDYSDPSDGGNLLGFRLARPAVQ
jgi:formylglycine-generating enzyme required for sulfatase activity